MKENQNDSSTSYSFDLSFLTEKFDLFHANILLSVKDISSPKRKASQMENAIKQNYFIFELAAQDIRWEIQKARIPSSAISHDDIWEILRREYVKYLENLSEFNTPADEYNPQPEGKIERMFSIEGHEFTSTQQRVGEKLRNCYHRWLEKGEEEQTTASAFREHTLTSSNGEALIRYFHHSSPVVQEKNFDERIQKTRKILENTLAKMQPANLPDGEKVPVTEIRLLSTSKGPGGNYQEVFETYVSALTSEEPPTMFFYGVNMARLLRLGGLQSWINTRSTNEMYEKVFDKLNLKQPYLLYTKARRIKLQEDIQKVLDSHADEKTKQKKCLALMKAHHRFEQRLQSRYRNLWEKAQKKKEKDYTPEQEQIIEDINTFHELNKKRRYLSEGYNGQIQATLVRLHRHVGDEVATGCYDAKDRDGMVTLVLESNEVYRDRHHGSYPNIFDKQVRKELKQIQIELMKKSTPAPVAEAVSMPNIAKGLDNTNQPFSGFGMLENIFMRLAGAFKNLLFGHHIHHLNFSYQNTQKHEHNLDDYDALNHNSLFAAPHEQPQGKPELDNDNSYSSAISS